MYYFKVLLRMENQGSGLIVLALKSDKFCFIFIPTIPWLKSD